MLKQKIGLKQLREDTNYFIDKVKKGSSFTIYRKSEPIFRITPPDEEYVEEHVEKHWEEVIDFTKFKKGGVNIDELLTRL